MIVYDPNVRLNVEPDLAMWSEAVDWMSRRVHMIKISSEDLDLLKPGVSAVEAAAQWLNAGVSLVVVTDGSRGALACTARDNVSVQAQPVDVLDTVGAGDTFQAALLCWLSEQGLLSPPAMSTLSAQQLRQALSFAARAAAITCSRRGADMPRRAELPECLSID